MDISFIYTQKRKEFGKPCSFTEVGPHVLVEIDPDPGLKKEFYVVTSVHREVDNSTRMCAHEINTESHPTESRGMDHAEGGWPAGVDTTDEDSMARFRKKVEKDKNYVNTVKSLSDIIETAIMDNNSIDVYEEYFKGDLINPENEVPFSTVNVFSDINDIHRRIVDLSWSSDSSKIAAAYSIEGIKNSFAEICMDSYIWDLQNPVAPIYVLKPELSLNTIEFSPRVPSLILGGYCNGQVAVWDIRDGNNEKNLSSVLNSHTQKVTGLKWIEDSNCVSFFSAAADGRVMSWDTRNLASPTQQIVLDPEIEDLSNLKEKFTVSCVEYDPTEPDTFMLGTEQGGILLFSRVCEYESESLIKTFVSSCGPILKIERNSFYPKLFASCDPWSTKIWSEVICESPVLNIMSQEGHYTDFAWSRSRPSLLYLTKTTGTIEVWDVPGKHSKPMMNVRLGKDSLYCISADYTGSRIACGTISGSVHVLEIPGYLKSVNDIELNLVSSMIGGGETVMKGQPKHERLRHVEESQSFSSILSVESSFEFEELWDPPEKAEDLYEENLKMQEYFNEKDTFEEDSFDEDYSDEDAIKERAKLKENEDLKEEYLRNMPYFSDIY